MAGPFVTSADVKKALAKKAGQPPTSGSNGQVLTRDTSTPNGTAWVTPAAGGGATTADATTTSNGVVRLAGDLAGTAAAPTLRQLWPQAATFGSSTAVPRITLDAAGRVTAVTEVATAVERDTLDQLVANLVADTSTATYRAVQALIGGGNSGSGTGTGGSTITYAILAENGDVIVTESGDTITSQ